MNQLIIEKIHNGEIPLKKAYKLYGQSEVDAALEEVKKSDEEILQLYRPEAVKEAVFKKLEIKEQNKARFTGTNILKISRVFAAAAAVVFVCGISFTTYRSITEKQNVPTERVKGYSAQSKAVSRLSIYKKTKDGVLLLKSGDFAQEGDLIQIAYDRGQKKYGLIFSVDGNNSVTKHFPEHEWTSCSLKNESTVLDFAYELDNAPDFEDFIFLVSNEQFSISEKEAYMIFAAEKYLSKKFNKVSKIEVKIQK